MRIRSLMAGTLVGLLAATTACSGGESGSDTVKIGFFAPETGFGSADGRSALAGAKLAVAQVNADGGIGGRKVELVTYDDASDPKQGAVIATKLVSQDRVVAAVSGSYSPQTLAAATIFQRNKIPLVSAYAVNPGIPETGDFVFQQDFDGEVQGRAGAVQFAEDGVTRPAIIAIDNDFGNALVEGFSDQAKDSGLDVVSTDKNEFGEKDFGTIIRRAVDAGADGIYLVQYVAEGTQFFRALRKSGVDLPVLSTEGIDSAGFLESIGDLADGAKITTNLNRDAEETATTSFLEDFAEVNDFPADMVAASSYDAVKLILDAADAAGTGAGDIQKGLLDTSDHAGATGTLAKFTAGRQVVKPVQVLQFQGATLVSVGEITDTAVITP
jgi:branched-chain amino acid transport system substrate-binding protein